MTNCNMKTERANILEIFGKPRFQSNFLLSSQIKPHQRLKNNVWGECPVIHRRKVYLELVNQAAISIWDKINELFVSTAVTLASPCLSRLSSLRLSPLPWRRGTERWWGGGPHTVCPCRRWLRHGKSPRLSRNFSADETETRSIFENSS